MGASLVPRPVCGGKNQPGNEAICGCQIGPLPLLFEVRQILGLKLKLLKVQLTRGIARA